MQLIGNMLAIKKDEDEEKTESGIILTEKKERDTGTVIAYGTDVPTRFRRDVTINSRVRFIGGMGGTVEFDGVGKLLLIEPGGILAVL